MKVTVARLGWVMSGLLFAASAVGDPLPRDGETVPTGWYEEGRGRLRRYHLQRVEGGYRLETLGADGTLERVDRPIVVDGRLEVPGLFTARFTREGTAVQMALVYCYLIVHTTRVEGR